MPLLGFCLAEYSLAKKLVDLQPDDGEIEKRNKYSLAKKLVDLQLKLLQASRSS